MGAFLFLFCLSLLQSGSMSDMSSTGASSRMAASYSSGSSPSARKSPAPYIIYLTFDDGPCVGSERVNELALKDNLMINVFLIGKNAYSTRNSKVFLKEYQANPMVEIGNHSFTHAGRHYAKYFKDPSEVLADFNRNQDSLKFSNNFARLPGRNFFRIDSFARDEKNSGREAADTLAARGYNIFGWDIEWRSRPIGGLHLHTGSEMLDIVDKMLREKKTFRDDRIIILLHDPELKDPVFVNALENFINRAKADGRYRFEHLSNYSVIPD